MKITSVFLGFAALILVASRSQAQCAVGATLTGQILVFDPDIQPGTLDAGQHGLVGTTLSSQCEFGATFRAGIEIRGTITRAGAIGVNSFGYGPRFSVAPHHWRVRPYAGFLVGGAYVRSDSSPKFTGRYLDFTVFTGAEMAISKHVDWRVFEYSYSTVSSEDNRNDFSTGIVYRFYKLRSER